MGTTDDLERWLWFLKLLDKKGLITIIEVSAPYKNRGDSIQYRQYIEIRLNAREQD